MPPRRYSSPQKQYQDQLPQPQEFRLSASVWMVAEYSRLRRQGRPASLFSLSSVRKRRCRAHLRKAVRNRQLPRVYRPTTRIPSIGFYESAAQTETLIGRPPRFASNDREVRTCPPPSSSSGIVRRPCFKSEHSVRESLNAQLLSSLEPNLEKSGRRLFSQALRYEGS